MRVDGRFAMTGNNGNKKAVHFDHPPHRVVSLVPSLTESMFELGFGEAVVGITDYCIYPEAALQGLPRLGGPKNPRIEEIIKLKPDLVLANQEENTPKTLEALEAAGIRVWVSFPQTVRQALDVLWTLVGLFQSQSATTKLRVLELTLEWNDSAVRQQAPRRYFCPIWQDTTSGGARWWMTFNRHTYASDVLHLVGGENCFANRQRRYPLSADLGLSSSGESPDSGNDQERDTRYPRLMIEEIRAADPEIILLPSEPYAFGEAHKQELCSLLGDIQAVSQGKVYLIDGSLITWHGTRLANAVRMLPQLFS